jgi:hypothetical protein
MFTPSSHDVRRFFCDAWRKQRAGEILTPMDAIAADWIVQHPEYHEALMDADEAVARDYSVEGGQPNPFLHLSMHAPRGPPPPPHDQLVARIGEHDAHHDIMECLGEMIWKSQRNGVPPDTDAYIECVRRRATR